MESKIVLEDKKKWKEEYVPDSSRCALFVKEEIKLITTKSTLISEILLSL